jgi:Na+-transporting methylmalonyl-CoA/oxaloacetate decarboxylase gamma subunit
MQMFALLPAQPSLIQAIEFIFVGFGVVLLVLSLLWLMTSVTGRFFTRQLEAEKALKEKTLAEDEERRRRIASIAAIAAMTSPQPPPGSHGESLPPHFIAILTAAAHEVLHEPVRILSIRSRTGGWGTEGRRQIFAGKHVR